MWWAAAWMPQWQGCVSSVASGFSSTQSLRPRSIWRAHSSRPSLIFFSCTRNEAWFSIGPVSCGCVHFWVVLITVAIAYGGIQSQLGKSGSGVVSWFPPEPVQTLRVFQEPTTRGQFHALPCWNVHLRSSQQHSTPVDISFGGYMPSGSLAA